jgi:hypothetical protein
LGTVTDQRGSVVSDGDDGVETVTQSHAGSGCSKCSKAVRLAAVAANAVRNGDLYRAIEILDELAVGDAVGVVPATSDRRCR